MEAVELNGTELKKLGAKRAGVYTNEHISPYLQQFWSSNAECQKDDCHHYMA